VLVRYLKKNVSDVEIASDVETASDVRMISPDFPTGEAGIDLRYRFHLRGTILQNVNETRSGRSLLFFIEKLLMNAARRTCMTHVSHT